ncbi:MAG: hypothetical protein ACRC17_07980, partial [Culicoidibacterales bacterium]
LQAEENFLDFGFADFDGTTFTIQPLAVFDQNGQKLEPTEIVLGMTYIPVEEVYVDGKIQIDAQLLGNQTMETVEIMYASTQTNFSVFTYHWLKK